MHAGIKAISAGFQHSMALARDGSVWVTGWNSYGQFGDGKAGIYAWCKLYTMVVPEGQCAVML